MEPASLRLFFSQQHLACEYQFETKRKARRIAKTLDKNPIPNIKLVEPVPLTVEDRGIVHDLDYIEAARTGHPCHLALSQGFNCGPELFPAVCASNDGIVAAALETLRRGIYGTLSSGLHPARPKRGHSTFNDRQ